MIWVAIWNPIFWKDSSQACAKFRKIFLKCAKHAYLRNFRIFRMCGTGENFSVSQILNQKNDYIRYHVCETNAKQMRKCAKFFKIMSKVLRYLRNFAGFAVCGTFEIPQCSFACEIPHVSFVSMISRYFFPVWHIFACHSNGNMNSEQFRLLFRSSIYFEQGNS